ncbi:hypothetical protein GO730_04040 [Spirosoma sp. HMF3257]|uniref:Uncharacterized protein n=1 Tax=Spirosoma telluris TaxID=2183553 RepID=A0A327NEM8_9BACT|nr:hypothetical protein [Spirosoma telluris]RAI73770.1 hypothetical protein HMF3257_03980 [Spirosoma telluris]
MQKVSTAGVATCPPCENPDITISGPICATDGSSTYTLNYTTTAGTTVQVSTGSASNGVISGINSGQTVTITVTNACGTKTITPPTANCIVCVKPILTVGNVACTGANSYSVALYTSSNTVNVSPVSAVVDVANRRITGIPLGTPVSVTALNGAGCFETMTVASPPSCATTLNCTLPQLTVGQPICNGNTYTVSFIVDGAGTVGTSAGSLNLINHTVSGILTGTNVVLTAINGTCVSSITVVSPVSCTDPCENPAITLSGPICSTSAIGTYVVNYTATAGTTVTPSSGTALNGLISGIPTGQVLSLTISTTNGCAPKVVTISPASCTVCSTISVVPNVGRVTCTNTATGSITLTVSGVPSLTVTSGVITPPIKI